MDKYFDLGNVVPLAFEVRDANGQLANATTATITVNLPDGTTTTLSPNNPGVGKYHFDYLPTLPGQYTARYVVTGALTAAEPIAFYVGAPPSYTTLPPLASLVELRGWVTEAQAGDDKAHAALVSASALVRSYCAGRLNGWVNATTGLLEKVPDPVREATVNVARRRALAPDDGVVDQTAGPFAVKRDTGLWLSATDKALLAPYRSGVTAMAVAGPIPWE